MADRDCAGDETGKKSMYHTERECDAKTNSCEYEKKNMLCLYYFHVNLDSLLTKPFASEVI